MNNPENLTIAETVSVFRIGRTRLFALIAAGEIEAFKLGRRTLVRAESAQAFIASLPRISQQTHGDIRASI
jgi:hypothetical protein